jgi:TolB-like protein/Tfp pilus assembly protein PilF
MSHLKKLIRELRRRRVLRVVAGYVVAAWVLLQVADLAFESLELPGRALSYVWFALFVGFPVALIFGWRYDLTTEGIVRTVPADADESVSLSLRRPDFVILTALAVVAVAIGYRLFTQVGDIESELSVSGSRDFPPNSIAVLPFVNMSSDPEQEYFSDGISEELLNLLTKIPELSVISRSSAFSFKGKDINVPEIASKLNVAHVLEGSVRKSGDRIRITAQLIDARSDTHLWSETYDRKLGDIFATQDEIAARVVDQLKLAILGPAPTVRETDPEAYALFLRARYLRLLGTPDAYEEAVDLYREALGIDPDYPPAWEGLAEAYFLQVIMVGTRSADEGFRLAREAINRALAIDPNFGVAVAGLGWLSLYYDQDLSAAARHFERAMMLDPTNLDVIQGVAHMAEALDRLDTAVAFKEYAVARDPMGPVGHFDLASSYVTVGRLDDAIESVRIGLSLRPDHAAAWYQLGTALMLKDEDEEAMEAMEQESLELYRLIGFTRVYDKLGRRDESDAFLNELIEKHAASAPSSIASIYARRGDNDRAFEWLEKAIEYSDAGLSGIASSLWFASLFNDPRWQPFLAKIGRSEAQLAAIEFNVLSP